MKTLENARHKQEILDRLSRLTPESQRRWGKMSAHQTVCHLADAKRMALGQKLAQPRQTWLLIHGVRYVALYAPMPWPHGIPTIPEANQEDGGTEPADFATDRQECMELCERFAALREFPPHPLFGPMSRWEWMRWGYLHLDHHLRQFGM